MTRKAETHALSAAEVRMRNLNRNAEHAVFEFTKEALVIILNGPLGLHSDRAGNGTGLLLATPAGNVVLLTAKHVLVDDPVPADGFTLGHWRSHRPLLRAVGKQWLHPSPQVDVAVALLCEEAEGVLRPSAIPTDCVAHATDAGFVDGDLTILCGCPFDYRTKEVDHRRGLVSLGYVPVMYFTTLEGRPDTSKGHERFVVSWSEGHIPDDATFTPAEHLSINVNEVFDLAHPGGISGGPLFRFRRPPRDGVWSASKGARVVGIASSFLDQKEYCPSVSAWGDWFRETISEFDEATRTLGSGY